MKAKSIAPRLVEGNRIHQVTLPRIHGLLVQEPSPHGRSTPGSETILRWISVFFVEPAQSFNKLGGV